MTKLNPKLLRTTGSLSCFAVVVTLTLVWGASAIYGQDKAAPASKPGVSDSKEDAEVAKTPAAKMEDPPARGLDANLYMQFRRSIVPSVCSRITGPNAWSTRKW